MTERAATSAEVKRANRQHYDAIAERYEELDGRRSPALERWLRARLRALRTRVPGGRLLDLGSGSCLVTRCAEGLFEQRVALDLSAKLLVLNRAHASAAVVADVDELPFPAGSFDLVTSFAVLHHLHGFAHLAREVSRVLRRGGLFYSDHDLDRRFADRLRLPLAIYRRLFRRAAEAGEEHDLTEYHHDGVRSDEICEELRRAGLVPEARYHWYGLSPVLNWTFRERSWPRGLAPLLAITAAKRS